MQNKLLLGLCLLLGIACSETEGYNPQTNAETGISASADIIQLTGEAGAERSVDVYTALPDWSFSAPADWYGVTAEAGALTLTARTDNRTSGLREDTLYLNGTIAGEPVSKAIVVRQSRFDDGKFHPSVVLAYVTSWSDVVPDPASVTHINYSFAHVTESFDGIWIENEERLRTVVALKKANPQLKVLLSVGGWQSGNFSEMAADEENRRAFVQACLQAAETFGLDGIDIDWEYPTSGEAGISASPDDTRNYTRMMQELRQALGDDRLLTLASAAWADYIDFLAIEPYVDFVNIMCYDLWGAPSHHCTLYRSTRTGRLSADEAVTLHKKEGMPASKLVLGLPFYSKSIPAIGDISYREIVRLIETGPYVRQWDAVACAPYLADEMGMLVSGYDDPESIACKCRYVHEKGMRGVMYWEYSGDDDAGSLRHAVYRGVMNLPE